MQLIFPLKIGSPSAMVGWHNSRNILKSKNIEIMERQDLQILKTWKGSNNGFSNLLQSMAILNRTYLIWMKQAHSMCEILFLSLCSYFDTMLACHLTKDISANSNLVLKDKRPVWFMYSLLMQTVQRSSSHWWMERPSSLVRSKIRQMASSVFHTGIMPKPEWHQKFIRAGCGNGAATCSQRVLHAIFYSYNNFSGHIVAEELQCIQVENFKANLTAHVQPNNAGHIWCFKAHYHQFYFSCAIDH